MEFGILFGMAEKERWKGQCGHPESGYLKLPDYISSLSGGWGGAVLTNSKLFGGTPDLYNHI